MAHRQGPYRIRTEQEYCAARTELDELLGSGSDAIDGQRVDELIASIENYVASARFLPDFSQGSGEPYANAA